MVSYVAEQWQTPGAPNSVPGWSPGMPLPQLITPDTAQQMLEVLRRLDELDKKLGALECKLKAQAKKRLIGQLTRRARKK